MKSHHKVRTKFISRLSMASISLVVGLLLAQTGNPQQIIEPPLPGLDFVCPAHVLAPGQPMSLLANVTGVKELYGEKMAKQLSYRWEVSGGKIIAGQGTPKVTIDASDVTSSRVGSVNVKVFIDGGPPELNREKSCTLKIDPNCSLPLLFDHYQDISLKDERARLDRLGKYLTDKGTEAAAFVVAYAGWQYCFYEAEWRANRAKKYLLDMYKVDANRIITIDGGFRDNFTMDIFIAPDANCGPFPTPDLRRTSHFTGSCDDKYKEP